MRTFDVISGVLASAVANGGTFVVSYPDGRDAGSYANGIDHQLVTNTYGTLSALTGAISLTLGTASITVTNNSGYALAAGTQYWLQFDQPGQDTDAAMASAEKMAPASAVLVTLGAPDTADADGVCASQDLLAVGAGVIAGALASGGVATFDVPRNVVAAWTNTAVITITGTDEYGAVVVESSASGTSLAGKKAFKTVTAVSISADATSLTVGSGDVLGLPVFLPSTGRVLKEMQDGAAATAGTLIAGVRTAPATATTGDVRGTYDPNSACNGSLKFELVIALEDPSYKGVAQFDG